MSFSINRMGNVAHVINTNTKQVVTVDLAKPDHAYAVIKELSSNLTELQATLLATKSEGISRYEVSQPIKDLTSSVHKGIASDIIESLTFIPTEMQAKECVRMISAYAKQIGEHAAIISDNQTDAQTYAKQLRARVSQVNGDLFAAHTL